MPSPDELYQRAHGASDIGAHLFRLRWLASIHDRVTEFGVRMGASTIALLSGNPQVVSYDLERSPNEEAIQGAFPGWVFRLGDTREVEIDDTDMLFVDTAHNGVQLAAELERHADRVSQTIVLHDMYCVELDGVNDPASMWRALGAFLMGGEWRIVFDEPESNGLTVIGRTQ